MQRRTLGKTQQSLPAIGLGCMGLSEFYGPPTEQAAAIKLLHEAIELGVEHFDTAEMYGIGANESLLGEAFSDRRDKVFIATKFGPVRDPETGAFTGLDGSRENCRRAVEGSLERLKTDVIDLYYLHRVDPNTPIEETVGAMAELVSEGKVRAIGLSEASGDTIRRAAQVQTDGAFLHPVMDKLKGFLLGVTPGPARHDDGNRAAVDNLFKIFAPIGLYDFRAEFGGDPTAQTQITRISFLQFLAHLLHVARAGEGADNRGENDWGIRSGDGALAVRCVGTCP